MTDAESNSIEDRVSKLESAVFEAQDDEPDETTEPMETSSRDDEIDNPGVDSDG
jgi:hypothetical protein